MKCVFFYARCFLLSATTANNIKLSCFVHDRLPSFWNEDLRHQNYGQKCSDGKAFCCFGCGNHVVFVSYFYWWPPRLLQCLLWWCQMVLTKSFTVWFPLVAEDVLNDAMLCLRRGIRVCKERQPAPLPTAMANCIRNKAPKDKARASLKKRRFVAGWGNRF